MRTETSYYQSVLGSLEIQHNTKEILSLKKIEDKKVITEDCELIIELKSQLDEYFMGKRKYFDVPYRLEGTEFQKMVWNELSKIPYGESCSYKDIAIKIGNEKASRAVGMANNKNPLMIIIPCHRVIGSSKKLIGYAGGLEMKKYLLELEKDKQL